MRKGRCDLGRTACLSDGASGAIFSHTLSPPSHAILTSGLVMWMPCNRRALKNRLRVSCAKGWRRFWYDSHVALGFYSPLLLPVMALTGLTWSFGWYPLRPTPFSAGRPPQRKPQMNRRKEEAPCVWRFLFASASCFFRKRGTTGTPGHSKVPVAFRYSVS